ncbi:MAG: phospholipase [Planctomycetota bacterium]
MDIPVFQTDSEHAGLKVRSLGPPAGEPVQAACVLCHGFGASGTDLVGIGEDLLRSRPALAKTVRLHFPEAPMDLGPMGMPGGRAWWMLNMRRLSLPFDERVEALRNERPEGVEALRTQFDSAIDSLLTLDGLPSGSLVVGGFSQGSMLATDYALRSDEPLGGLAILSGALVMQAEWSERAGACPPRRVFQSHGRHDDILPYAAGEGLRDLLTGADHTVRFEPFDGPHTIPPVALEGIAELLDAVVDR